MPNALIRARVLLTNYARAGCMPGEEGVAAMNPLQEVTPNTAASGGVESDYRSRLEELNRKLSHTQPRQRAALVMLLGCSIALVVSSVWDKHAGALAITTISAAGVVFFLHRYLNSRRASAEIALRCGFYERGLARLRRDWKSLERTGEEFARSCHLYQSDLQILGERSLFSLLCTTRSQAGASRLAYYLLDSVDYDEARARQEAIRELRGSMALREQIALLGKHQFQGCDTDRFHEWFDTPLLRTPSPIPIILFVSGAFTLLSAVAILIQIVSLTHVLPFVLPVLLVEMVVGVPLFRGVRLRLRLLRTVATECSVLRQGLHLLESQRFTSSKLRYLVDRAQASDASLNVRRLEWLFEGIAQREKEWFYLASLMVCAGTQLVLAAERWRAKYQEQLRQWSDLWAEFDALNAIACYAYENPDHVFPELVDGAKRLVIEGVGHPLLPFDRCVRNDVVLDESLRFWILSGSNMAGKSTLLRAIGVNAVLAYAGAPIRASYAQISHFSICASISLSDSMLDGRSKFLAEAERLTHILQKTGAERPVLFLIDEILSGTNSDDRRMACEAIVRVLIAGNAVGILSTHDLALTAIAEEPELNGRNYFMESGDLDQPLNFDYCVKPGISRRSSAMAILKLLGIGGRSR